MLSFEITLQENAEPEVIEWFEFMNRQCILSKEIIKLVSQYIASHPMALEAQTNNCTIENNIGDPLANLFNWKDSSSTLFTKEKKQKKTMLIV